MALQLFLSPHADYRPCLRLPHQPGRHLRPGLRQEDRNPQGSPLHRLPVRRCPPRLWTSQGKKKSFEILSKFIDLFQV